MAKKEEIKVKDLTKIKSITFKYPEIMDKNADQIIRNTLITKLKLEDSLQEAREKVRNLEESLMSTNNVLKAFLEIADIEYEDKVSESIKNNTYINIQGCDNTRY